MKRILNVSLLAALFLSMAVQTTKADDRVLLEEARQIATTMPPKLMAVLNEEIAKGGMASAIKVCREKAPQMAAAASEKTGWHIRRVSLQNRNPKAVPDEWETSVLREFDSLAAAGRDPATLEKTTIAAEGNQRSYRYMKALPTQALCLNCHGTGADIPADVQAKLRELYPDDKATGYQVGEIRGAITIKRALP